MLRNAVLPIGLIALAGCAGATRLSISPEESHYERTIPHLLGRAEAFHRVDIALSSVYDDVGEVLKDREPATGTFVAKSLVSYWVGGTAFGLKQHALYTLRIVVEEDAIDMGFELGPEMADGTWAPKTEIPRIREAFDAIVATVEATVARP